MIFARSTSLFVKRRALRARILPSGTAWAPASLLVSSQCVRNLNGGSQGGPQSGPQIPAAQDEEEQSSGKPEKPGWGPTLFKMFESAVTTLASVSILGLIGYSYTQFYKYHVLQKMEHAFEPGDPVLELAALGKDTPPAQERERGQWIERSEQNKIDRIINGTERGKYFLLIGEKGTGKSSMMLEAMAKIDGEGVAFFDAHADPEIFRIRLGKALDFEFHEDNIGSLFSIRGPRDATALLDIERAFNKLEKVALKRRKEVGRPLILIMNSMHLIRDDEDGKDLLELVQQRAEQWAAGDLCTMVFNSDDYWIYERLKVQAARMEVVPILDLTKKQAMEALKQYRIARFQDDPSPEILENVYNRIGGRMAYLGRVAKSPDMEQVCDEINAKEKAWFLAQCGILGAEMDDDVMDQQKYASAAMVFAKALVDKEKEMEASYDPERGHILPQIPLHDARYIMTRADFIQSYDHVNIFTIDSKANVRADSVPMMNAFREVCSQPGFDEFLQATLDRISDIESLGRTKELTLKDLWNKGQYQIQIKNARGQLEKSTIFEVAPKEDDDE